MLEKYIGNLAQPSTYKDKYYEVFLLLTKGTNEQYIKEINATTTVYVGNLSFYTTEEQVYELFSMIGEIKRVIMGLDRVQKTPCGFCFVEYFTKEAASDCKRYVDGTKLDDRFLRIDLDPGFRPGRQFGRGKSGGQLRDEFRTQFDPGRGGWGKGTTQEDDSRKRGRYENRNPRFRNDKSDSEHEA